MAIITLTTDMGLQDHYVAVVKGAILRQHPGAVIVDVSHSIRVFDNAQAAYAQLLGVQLGGWNRYAEQLRAKPLLARGCPAPTASSVVAILELTRRLEALWLGLAAAAALCLGLVYH